MWLTHSGIVMTIAMIAAWGLMILGVVARCSTQRRKRVRATKAARPSPLTSGGQYHRVSQV